MRRAKVLTMRRTRPEIESGPLPQAAGFVRVSKPDQVKGFSPEAQADELVEIAAEAGYQLPREFIFFDHGFQGDDFDRPAIAKGLELIRSQQVKAAIFWSIDRMARDVRGGLTLVEEIRKMGANVVFGDLGEVKPDDDDLEVHMQMKLVWAQAEKKRISRRSRLGINKKLRDQLIPAGRPGFGYRSKGDGHWEPHPTDAAGAKKLFELRAAGKGLGQIATYMRAKYPIDNNGKVRKWHKSTVRHILQNRLYIGEHIYGKSEMVEPKTHRKPLSELHNKKTTKRAQPKTNWKHLAVPALVSVELFEAAETASRRRSLISRGRPGEKRFYLLRAMLYCKCGSRACGFPTKGRIPFRYRCRRCAGMEDQYGAAGTCKSPSIHGPKLETTVWNTLIEEFTDRPGLEQRLKKWAQMETTVKPEKLDAIRRRIDSLRRREQAARRKALDALDEPDTQAFYDAEAKATARERREVERQLETAVVTMQPFDAATHNLWQSIGVQLAQLDQEDRREVAEILIARVTFLDAVEIVIDLRIPTGRAKAKPLRGNNLAQDRNCTIFQGKLANFYPLTVRRQIA